MAVFPLKDIFLGHSVDISKLNLKDVKLHGGTVVTLDPRQSDDKTQHNVMKQFSGSALQLYVHDIAAQPGDLVNFLLTALGSLSSVLQPT